MHMAFVVVVVVVVVNCLFSNCFIKVLLSLKNAWLPPIFFLDAKSTF